jgi:hypothetical protein
VQKDGTISLDNVVFEAPQFFVGQQVDVLFDPQVADQAWIRTLDNALVPIAPVRTIDNSSIPRRYQQVPINWSALINDTTSATEAGTEG